MATADSGLITWLFEDSGISRYQISKDTGIPESTLSRIAGGVTTMDVVSFGIAARLTGYAEGKRHSRAYLDEYGEVNYLDETERVIIPDKINMRKDL